MALQYNPQSSEVSKKIKRITQLAREKKRALEVENIRSSFDMRNFLDPLKPEFVSSWYLDLSYFIWPTNNGEGILDMGIFN